MRDGMSQDIKKIPKFVSDDIQHRKFVEVDEENPFIKVDQSHLLRSQRGVIAKTDIPKGTVIGEYSGKLTKR
jgi:hypothetical protein